MEIFTTDFATSGRALRAARTRTAVAYPSTVMAPVCLKSADLGDQTHQVTGGRPPRGSVALH